MPELITMLKLKLRHDDMLGNIGFGFGLCRESGNNLT